MIMILMLFGRLWIITASLERKYIFPSYIIYKFIYNICYNLNRITLIIVNIAYYVNEYSCMGHNLYALKYN